MSLYSIEYNKSPPQWLLINYRRKVQFYKAMPRRKINYKWFENWTKKKTVKCRSSLYIITFRPLLQIGLSWIPKQGRPTFPCHSKFSMYSTVNSIQYVLFDLCIFLLIKWTTGMASSISCVYVCYERLIFFIKIEIVRAHTSIYFSFITIIIP